MIEDEEDRKEQTDDSDNESALVFHFDQYSKCGILKPVAIYAQSSEEEEKMEILLNDPVVLSYTNLPMAGSKKEKLD